MGSPYREPGIVVHAPPKPDPTLPRLVIEHGDLRLVQTRPETFVVEERVSDTLGGRAWKKIGTIKSRSADQLQYPGIYPTETAPEAMSKLLSALADRMLGVVVGTTEDD